MEVFYISQKAPTINVKALNKELIESPRIIKTLEWAKLVTITGSSQILIQVISFVCGILVIRLLPTHEYALYTLANTMLGMMTVLADGGIASGVAAQGGKVWKSPSMLGEIFVTGMELRKKFAIGSLIITTPALFFLLRYHDASWIMSFLIVASLIPAFFSALSGTLLQIPPKLLQDIKPLQKNQIGVNSGRLLLLVITLFAFPWAFVAILSAGIPQIWSNIRLRKISRDYVDWNQKSNKLIEKEIYGFVKRLLPGSIFYCLSGQLTIWLISIFGSTAAIAQIGALGRLAMVLSLFHAIISTLITPRFARLPEEKSLLYTKYIEIHIFLFALSFFLIGIVWLFPSQILLVLGEEYAGFEMELLLVMIGGCLNLIIGINFLLNSNRGWMLHPILGISIGIAAILVGILILDITTLKGVLYFNIFITIIGLCVNILFGFIKIQQIEVLKT